MARHGFIFACTNNLIHKYTKPGDIVLDPMAGSGTTVDVCREEGRKARAIAEVDTGGKR